MQQKKLFWEVCKYLGPWRLPGQGCGQRPGCAVSAHHERHPTSRDSLTHPSNNTFYLPFCHWGKEVWGVGVHYTHGGFIQVGVPLWSRSASLTGDLWLAGVFPQPGDFHEAQGVQVGQA